MEFQLLNIHNPNISQFQSSTLKFKCGTTEVIVRNISLQIDLLGCSDTQLFADFCNEHLTNNSTEYSNALLEPVRTLLNKFKQTGWLVKKNKRVEINGKPVSLTHIFKQPPLKSNYGLYDTPT